MLTKRVFQIRYHAFLHELTCYGSCTLMCHTGQFNEHIRLFETLYRGKLKGYHCNSWLYTCIYMYMYIHYKYVVSSHIRTFIWHHDILPLSNGIMQSFVSSHLKSHFTLDMDHIESCGYFSNDKDIEKALTTSKSLGIFSLYILCSLSICIGIHYGLKYL